jgi:hypothetical protein
MILRNCKRQKKGRKRAKEQTSKRANKQTKRKQKETKGNKMKKEETNNADNTLNKGLQQFGEQAREGRTGKGRAFHKIAIKNLLTPSMDPASFCSGGLKAPKRQPCGTTKPCLRSQVKHFIARQELKFSYVRPS